MLQTNLSVYCHQKQKGHFNANLLSAQSEPVLKAVFSEADTIKDEEDGGVGPFGARGQRAADLLWDDPQNPARRVVAHLHQLVWVWRFQR